MSLEGERSGGMQGVLPSSTSLAREPFVRAAGAASARNGEVADAGPHRSSAAGAVPSHDGHGRPLDEQSRNATESLPPSSRSEVLTLVRPSDAEFAYAATMAVADQPLFGGAEPPADWCIDLGERLITLSTFDAWSAIARGQVRGVTFAWREGLECWTPVEELPELACALSAEPTPEPVATDITAPDSLAAFELAEPTTHELRPPPLARAPVSTPIRAIRRPAMLGAVVAAAAILVAAFRPAPATAAAPAAEAQRAGLEMRAARVTNAVLAAAVAEATPASARPAPRSPRDAPTRANDASVAAAVDQKAAIARMRRLFRRRLRAGRGTLNPLIGVRIPAPEPIFTALARAICLFGCEPVALTTESGAAFIVEETWPPR